MSTDAPCTCSAPIHIEFDCEAKKLSSKEKSHSQALIHVFAMVLFYAARSDSSSSSIYRMLNAKAQWNIMNRHPHNVVVAVFVVFLCVWERLGLVRLHSILTFSHCSSWTGCGERGCAKVYVRRDHTIQSQATYNCAMALNITYPGSLCTETNSGAPWNCIECALRSCTLYQPTSWDAVQRVHIAKDYYNSLTLKYL